jgi:hypothetical protein
VRRVYVVVEGQTEESFVQDVLAEVLWIYQVYLTPILLGVPGHRGGRTSYARVRKDVLVQLKQDRAAYCSTMLDYYGLGRGFPGTPPPVHLSSLEKVKHVEQAVRTDIYQQIPDLRPDVRFLPYLQLHEFEGLLFSDPTAFAASLRHPHLAQRFQAVRDEFETPEDINNDLETCPSQRVIDAYPSYRKVLEGTLAARAIGIETMRRECPHFRDWLGQLQSLGE